VEGPKGSTVLKAIKFMPNTGLSMQFFLFYYHQGDYILGVKWCGEHYMGFEIRKNILTLLIDYESLSKLYFQHESAYCL